MEKMEYANHHMVEHVEEPVVTSLIEPEVYIVHFFRVELSHITTVCNYIFTFSGST